MTSRIGIGIPVYNAKATIERCLQGLLAQSFKDFEALIADNGSTDGSLEICQRAVGNDPRFRIVRHAQNFGRAFNYEYVFKNSTAPYFLWLFSDDYYSQTTYLENLHKGIEGRDFAFPIIRKFRMRGNRQAPLKDRNVPMTGETFRDHRAQMLKSYLGYQAIYGLSRRSVLEECRALWFASYFRDDIPDEEPYLHFILSRYRYIYVMEACYHKDMTHSVYATLGLSKSFCPMIWQTIAVIGVIAQAPYKNFQKLQLAAIKVLRTAFVLCDLAIHSLKEAVGLS